MNDSVDRMDLELRRVCAGLGRPALSREFGALLQERLAHEKRLQRLARRRLRLMQVYWLTICAASLYIVSSWMRGIGPLSLNHVVLAAAGLALLALPLALLLRGLRLSLMDLVFGTLDGLHLPPHRST